LLVGCGGDGQRHRGRHVRRGFDGLVGQPIKLCEAVPMGEDTPNAEAVAALHRGAVGQMHVEAARRILHRRKLRDRYGEIALSGSHASGDRDGIAETIRNRDLNIRVAMVTAVDPDFDIIEMPFDDYIIKPVSRDELYETIDRLLNAASYEEKMRQYYALSAKHATLSANKPESELSENQQFQKLTERMNSLRDELDDTLSEFDDDDFAAAFRDLARPPLEHFE